MADRANPTDECDFEDAEMAAAMAAVNAYMKAEAAERAASEPAASMSPWLAASLIEAVSHGRARIVSAPACPAGAALWLARACQCFLSLCLAGCLAVPSAPKALGQEAREAAPVLAGQANAGQSCDSPEPGKPTLIRVGLATNVASLELGAPDGAQVYDRATGALVASLPPEGHWTVTAQAGQIAFCASPGEPAAQLFLKPGQVRRVAFRAPVCPDNSFAQPTAPPDERLEPGMSAGLDGYVVVPPQPEGIVAVNGRLYRGILWVRTSQAAPGTVSAINILDLEDYLLAVVPAEMPSSWPMEALKAQAIVARSYAIANLGKNEAQGFDVKTSEEDQVYPGIVSETEATNEAVAATDGIVVKHEGRPVSTFFHSTSGGFTELAEFVWGTQAPYLKSVPDYDDASPHFVWSRSLSPADLETKLTQSGGNVVGQVLGIFVLSRAPSGRVRQLLVTGTSQTILLSGDDVRRLLKLPSTNFNIGLAPGAYLLQGRGFGHGLGMSQWGARALAERGYNAAQILTYYYKDVSLDYF